MIYRNAICRRHVTFEFYEAMDRWKLGRQSLKTEVQHGKTIEGTLNRFLPEGMLVSIALRPGGDTQEFGSWLRGVFGARSNQVKRVRC